MKDLAWENMDVPLSPIPTDASVKYFFSFYQKLSCRNPTCHRNISTQVWIVDNLLGTKEKKKMKGILLVCFGSFLMSLEPGLDMMTDMTIMHTTVILILFLPVTPAVKARHNLDVWEFPPQNGHLLLYADGPGL